MVKKNMRLSQDNWLLIQGLLLTSYVTKHKPPNLPCSGLGL